MTKREVARTPALLWSQANHDVVYILERGTPKYRVEAVTELPDPFDDLIRAGVLEVAQPPQSPNDITETSVECRGSYTTAQVASLVAEDKGDH